MAEHRIGDRNRRKSVSEVTKKKEIG
uniref:Uncharacterized protein n=1 Tax=Arundo donax TaxID=35708 RepID=A0A0A9C2E6_ARUDO